MTQLTDMSADQLLILFRQSPERARIALLAGAALHKAGRVDEAIAVWHLGDERNPALRLAHTNPAVVPAMKDLSRQADEALRAHFSGLHRDTVDKTAAELGGADLSRIREAVWIQYADMPVTFPDEKLRPSVFYVPGLPPLPVPPRSTLPWAEQLEDAFPVIRAEFDAAVQSAQLSPYIPKNASGDTWQALAGTLDWASLHLYANAKPTPSQAQFPKTLAAFDKVPLACRGGTPIELFFSILEPGAHIPPHFGQSNARLTVHLPIHVPENCGIRVGDETHEWREGRVLAFDDSFDHEAWNRSDQSRAVLIFEIPHPDLTEAENTAITRVYEAFDAWMAKRQHLLKP